MWINWAGMEGPNTFFVFSPGSDDLAAHSIMEGKTAIVIGAEELVITEEIPSNATYFCRCFYLTHNLEGFEIINGQELWNSSGCKELPF